MKSPRTAKATAATVALEGVGTLREDGSTVQSVPPAGGSTPPDGRASAAAPTADGLEPCGGGLGNPTPLTAGFHGRNRDATPIGTPFIDRISFTCRLPFGDERTFAKWAQTSTSVGERFGAKTPGYRYAWTLGDGIRLEYGDRASGASKNLGMLRLDYNPAKHDLADIEGLSRWIQTDWNLTRVDVAIDYPHDLSAGFFHHDTLRKGATFRGADGQLETVYLGSPASSRYFRIYDKKRERAHKGEEMPQLHLWRVEVEHRCAGRDAFPPDLLDGLSVSYLSDTSQLAWTTRCVLAQCVQNPATLKDSSVPRETRRRYRDLLDKHALPLDPDPRDLYRARRLDLYAALSRIQVEGRGYRCAV